MYKRQALRLLNELGVERTLEGADGLHALDVLRQHATPPDVVLVDLDMPGMDGIECIGLIAHERLARAVAVVSALDPVSYTHLDVYKRQVHAHPA